MDFNANATADYLELRRRRVQEILLNREMRGSNDEYNFKNLVIPGIELRSANLYAGNRVSFSNCDLRFSDFSFANAARTYFSASNLCFSNFDDATLTRATFGDTTRVAGASFRRADLEAATMYLNVMLLTADFTDAKNIDSMYLNVINKDRRTVPVIGFGVDPETGALRPQAPSPAAVKRASNGHLLFSQIYDQMELPAKMLNESIVNKLRDPQEPRARTELAALPELMALLEKTLPLAPLQIIPAPRPEAPKPPAPRLGGSHTNF
jgi:hypothetical protein